jgi:tRNA1(Val) A37 N6-methylase TrmN6
MQPEFTEDSILRDDIRIRQPARGYRFAIDAVLLAHFIKTVRADRLLEIGSGTGVVTVLVSALQKFQSVVAVEIQNELAELCRFNFEANKVPNAKVLTADVKNLQKILDPNSFEVIYSNPPYRKSGSGKTNPQNQKAIARHEIQMQLEDLFECASSLMKSVGRLITILPIFREKDFGKLIDQYNFHVNERMYVFSFTDDKSPKFFLTISSKILKNLVERPPLSIYKSPGQYTDEMKRLLKL